MKRPAQKPSVHMVLDGYNKLYAVWDGYSINQSINLLTITTYNGTINI